MVKSDDSIWFTDPLFGMNGEWEGKTEKPEQATTNVYRIAKDGKLTAVITNIVNPNGLAFSLDEKKLYVVEWKGTPKSQHLELRRQRGRHARQPHQGHRRRGPGALMASRSIATAICGAEAGTPCGRRRRRITNNLTDALVTA